LSVYDQKEKEGGKKQVPWFKKGTNSGKGQRGSLRKLGKGGSEERGGDKNLSFVSTGKGKEGTGLVTKRERGASSKEKREGDVKKKSLRSLNFTEPRTKTQPPGERKKKKKTKKNTTQKKKKNS